MRSLICCHRIMSQHIVVMCDTFYVQVKLDHLDFGPVLLVHKALNKWIVSDIMILCYDSHQIG